MKTLQEINQSIAHITQTLQDGRKIYFQVLNEAGDDWDEEKTTIEYQRDSIIENILPQ
jgi:hypothetical protein